MATQFEVRRTLEIEAPAHQVWDVITSPALMKKWMLVSPEIDGVPLARGSKVKWLDDNGRPYLTGAVSVFEPHRRLVLELDDASWTREARPGEVTYSMTLSAKGDGVELEFRLGDLSIDPQAQQWRDAYAESRELENIKELAEA